VIHQVQREEFFLPGFDFFIKGLILGFSIAAPVGPIGLLCIRRTLANSRLHGLVSGLGAATADAFYGSIAGFGLTLISNFLVGQQSWIRLLGGVFLIYLGIKIFLALPSKQAAGSENTNLAGAYLSTVLLTLTNPATILSFIAIFAGFGVTSQAGQYATTFFLVSGVFCGSALWWFILSSVASVFRTRLTTQWMVWINRSSGLLITAFGVVAIVSLLSR
jgi:threonine/homoserine/homoserine lactone efflux protein